MTSSALKTVLMLLAAWHAVTAAETRPLPPGVESLQVPGLHNVFAVSTNVFSGSSPQTDEAFAGLAKLGIRTLISVDGAAPETEAARKHGLRYVHLPHGYDGIPTSGQLQLAKAGAVLEGPIYVHCHHGKHRAPAAAAILCMANEGWSTARAEAWMKVAGTSTDYAGLYQTVREFRPPSAEQLGRVSGEFPESAKVSGLVESMVEIDGHWERLKAARAAGWSASPKLPDSKPVHDALLLWERYREAQRLPESLRRGTNFVHELSIAEAEVKELEELLRVFAKTSDANLHVRLEKSFRSVAHRCVTCHKAHRD